MVWRIEIFMIHPQTMSVQSHNRYCNIDASEDQHSGFEDSFSGQSNAQHCFTQRWCDERQRAMANGELSGFFLSDLIDDRTQQRPAHFTEHRVCWTTAEIISSPLSLHSVLSLHFLLHGSDQKWFSYTKTLMQSVQTQRRTFHKRFWLVPKPSILPT